MASALKNSLMPSAASADLGIGLGDDLKAQVEAQVNERKKKLQQAADAEQGQGIYNPLGLSAAAQSLGLMAQRH